MHAMFRFVFTCQSLLLIVASGPVQNLLAEESAPSFHQLLKSQQQKTFEQVEQYLKASPNAADANAAYLWYLTTAQEAGWEVAAMPLAKVCEESEKSSPALQKLARRVYALGLAESGKVPEALVTFKVELRQVRLRSPEETVTFAMQLADKAQLAGDADAVPEIYTQLSDALFLNSQVRRICDGKLAKAKLVGQTLPEISVEDLEGNKISTDDYQGDILILDFWATNCLPCLKEFPNLKQLQSEYSRQGVKILGISLDDSSETVEEFTKRIPLPWTLALSTTDQDATRERFQARTIPTVFLVDRQGKIRAFDLKGSNLRAAVEKLLKEKP